VEETGLARTVSDWMQDPAVIKELLGAAEKSVDPKSLAVSEVGPAAALALPEVEVELVPSRQIPIAGELWSILGTIENRSTTPIWIVDARTVLTVAPEMWGQTSRRGSIGAFFPTVKPRSYDEIVRIDPQCEYAVVWKIDPYQRGERQLPGYFEVLARIVSSIKDFAFFNPGRFTVSATVHIWPVPPIIQDDGTIGNWGESLPVSVMRELEMEASPWVLIVGAIIGGTLSFVLQLLAAYSNTSGQTELELGLGLVGLVIGFLVAILLPAITTILLSRLATTDFLLVVRVKDIWGAVAAGFIIQWFGYGALLRLLESVSLGAQ